MRVLFLPRYGPLGGPSRYLIYDNLPWFEKAGIQYDVLPMLDDRYLLYTQAKRRGQSTESLLWLTVHLLGNAFKRLWKVLTAFRYDVIVLEKDLFSNMPYFAEAFLFKINANVVSLYDDAIHEYYSDQGGLVSWLTRDKVGRIMRNSRAVVVWNERLADYARARNADVTVMPLGFDMERYRVRTEWEVADRPLYIGWMGTTSSFEYVHELDPVFARLAQEHNIKLFVVSSEDYVAAEVPVKNARWSVATEVDDLRSMDIGIMPLPDTPWAAGKSGCKMLQYMSVGVPAVVSPVGINGEIIADGVNGRLASTPEEWYQVLSELIANEQERRKLGLAGRRHVEEHNSLETIAEELRAIIIRAGRQGAP